MAIMGSYPLGCCNTSYYPARLRAGTDVRRDFFRRQPAALPE